MSVDLTLDPPADMHAAEQRDVAEVDRTPATVGALDLLALFLAATSLAAMALLVYDEFRPAVAAGIGLAVCAIAIAVLRLRIRFERPPRLLVDTAILLVGAVARADIYPHLIGGQDEGLYTNMAIQFRRSRSLVYADSFRSSLSASLRTLYDKVVSSGTELVDGGRSLYTIDFYPLHPVWMSMFGSVLGDGRQTVSLVFFGWFGAVMAMSLARQLAPGTIAPTLVAAFFAVNPALAFFAKFPVTEIVASAFALAGFNYLLRAVRETATRRQVLFAIISVGSFAALSFVRFQLLLYVPFFLALVLVALTRYWPKRTRILLLTTVLATVAVLIASMIYYQRFQPTLYTAAMASIKPHVSVGLVAAAVLMVAAILGAYAIAVKRRRAELADRAIDAVARWSPWLLVLVFAATLASILDAYKSGEVMLYDIATHGDPWIFRYSVIWRLILFVSPVAVLVVVVGGIRWKQRPPAVNAAILLLCVCWTGMLLQPYAPYLYYYGRYLVSDVVPLVLILAAVFLSRLHMTGRRATTWAAAASIIALSLVWTIPQIGHREGEDPGFNKAVADLMGDRDLLVYSATDDRYLLPLRVAYGQHVMVVPNTPPATEDAAPWTLLMADLYDRTVQAGGAMFFASPSPVERPGWDLRLTRTFTMHWFSNDESWRDGTIQKHSLRSLLLPVTNRSQSETWYVYELHADAFAGTSCAAGIGLTTDHPPAADIAGFSGPEPAGSWTGTEARAWCAMPEAASPTAIEVHVAAAMTSPTHDQRVVVSVNGTVVATTTLTSASPSLDIEAPVPPDLEGPVEVTIDTPDAISPATLTGVPDDRIVGIYVSEITFSGG